MYHCHFLERKQKVCLKLQIKHKRGVRDSNIFFYWTKLITPLDLKISRDKLRPQRFKNIFLLSQKTLTHLSQTLTEVWLDLTGPKIFFYWAKNVGPPFRTLLEVIWDLRNSKVFFYWAKNVDPSLLNVWRGLVRQQRFKKFFCWAKNVDPSFLNASKSYKRP